MLDEEGGAVGGEDLGEILNISRQAVDARRKAGKLLALTTGNRKYLYPLWQVRDGQVLPGLEQVLDTLGEFGPWPQAQFMMEPNIWLNWDTPLNRLRSDDLNSVLSAAHKFAD